MSLITPNNVNGFTIPGNSISLNDIKNTLVQSKQDIERALDAIEKYECQSSSNNEMQMIMTISGTEITLSRCFELIRKRYV